jgi:hypothetical protein
VLLDDGTADRQAHSHAAGRRRMDRLEDAVGQLRVDARPRVLHRDMDAIVALP